MAKVRPPQRVLRFAGVFSRYPSALDWACQTASENWGTIVLQSKDFDFEATTYYEPSMGSGLKKRLVAFGEPMDPAELPQAKLSANQWEETYAARALHSEERPVNIDPGYVTEAKVVLATMKDRDHRIYIGQNVFAEVTLFFQLPGQWQSSRWTYPDYLRPDYHEFFSDCRDRLRACLRQPPRTK